MAAPEFVPVDPTRRVRSYSSPPRREGSWLADRPGELDGSQPLSDQLGVPGPDQGYALTLVARFAGRLTLRDGEHEADALAGGAAIAMKRSGLFGRAPVIHDVTAGLTVWGFLDPDPPTALVALRREWFDEVHLSIHYSERRRIVDAVPAAVLRLPHTAIAERHQLDWRACLDLDAG